MRFRPTTFAATALAVALVSSACGSSGEQAGSTSSASVTISQANGTTEFPVGTEKRIVATGYSIDNLLALGIKPVALVQYGQEIPTPWQKGKLDGIPIIKSADGKSLPVEEIAKYKPDLFAGDYYIMNKSNFDALSGVTKVLGGIAADGEAAGWKAQLEALGKILGLESKVKEIEAADTANVERLAKKYPGLKGKTALVTQYVANTSQFNLVSDPKDSANALFASLGMTVPKAVRDNPSFKTGTEGGGRGFVSLELIPTISANFMAIFPSGATAADLDKLPGYATLPQVKSGATLVADRATIVAMNQPSSLSRAWVLEKIEPQLETAAEQPAVP
ncbi:ABC transporter substrate-binding protein [Tsukamurella sp. 8F]|uniref:ABC transporter substrate-binding protein n=1 Tax=unclassified Tsukamurella TaxID=2633480 RepID=UPI0023B91466|nr:MULTISPECIES: ABC transporter substrate-binding protein [unclassified Tsukamurella]MDF0529428.1 ABC transporter substrate-binding protein [Tsukamurella sp. 8J]MDF0587065.1 ABC transporter substrate-binding protein [Tsukamurella sp. 8F]